MQNNSVLRVAFVGVVAILVMLFMVSLLGRHQTRIASTGAAYTSTQSSLITDGVPNPSSMTMDVETRHLQSSTLDSVLVQQEQLSQIIGEEDPQQKLELAKDLSRFTSSSSLVFDESGSVVSTPTS